MEDGAEEGDDDEVQSQHSIVLGTPPSPTWVDHACELLGAPEQEGQVEGGGEEASAAHAGSFPGMFVWPGIEICPFTSQMRPCDLCEVLTSVAAIEAAFPRWGVRERLARGADMICPLCSDGPCVVCGYPAVDREKPCVWCDCPDPVPLPRSRPPTPA